MPYEFRMQRRVEFAETDMAGIMHFANYFRFMEATEHAFFRSLGFRIHAGKPEDVGWPRVHVACDYREPLHFEDVVEVHLLVREVRSKAITYDFHFRRVGGDPAKVTAYGRFTTVCVAWDGASGRMRAVDIPAPIAAAIVPAPAALLPEP